MFKSFRHRLRRAILPPGILRDLEALRLSQGRILTELNRAKSPAELRECEFRVFSQFGEDGIIQKLISTIPIPNKMFIEFGVEDFLESNCRFLMMNDNWRGFVVDGSERWISAVRQHDWFWKYDLNARCAVISRDNINAELLRSGFPSDIGVLSIDVDGIDYWLVEALSAYSPRILIVEYNSVFGSERKISVPYDPAFSRRARHFSELYYGASLGALEFIAAKKGYSLVGTESAGVNAFFVRNDLMNHGLRKLAVGEAHSVAQFRQSRNAEGMLNYLSGEARYDAIRGLPVVNVETGEPERL